MAAPLEVTLVFWHREIRNASRVGAIPVDIANALPELLQPKGCQWHFQRCDAPTDIHNEGIQFWAKIQHHEFSANDHRAGDAISALCEYLFLESSVLAIDSFLNRSKLLMGPLSETSMETTDRMFGGCFSLHLLNQLNSTKGVGLCAQKAARTSGYGFTRNASKWFHAPLYAGLCVTNCFIFFDGPLQEISAENIDKIAALSDKDLHQFFEMGKWIISCAKLFSSWAPNLNSKIETQIQELDPAKKKENLQASTKAIVSGGNMLGTLTQRLGTRDPNVLESRQICSTMTTMIGDCESLRCAAGDYVDSCVGKVVKNAVFGAGALSAAYVAAGAIVCPPVGIGAVGLSAIWGTYFTGSLVGCYFSGETASEGFNLHRSRQVRRNIRMILISLMSFRLFLLLMLYKTQECLDRNSGHYQEFKDKIKSQCSSDLDKFAVPGYVNEIVNELTVRVTGHIQALKKEVDGL